MSPYDTWTSGFNLSGTDAEWSADPDTDGLDNLTEYGLGGNPTNANDMDVLPTFALVEAGEINWMEYVYRRRSDAAIRGLDYYLELNTNLVAGVWTNSGYIATDPGGSAGGFEVVTNFVPTESFSAMFIRLRIESE